MEKNQEEDLEANKKGGIFGLGVKDMIVDKAKDIGSVLQHAIHDAFVSENKEESKDLGDKEGTFESQEGKKDFKESDKKNFKFEASDFDFGKLQKPLKDLEEGKSKDKSSAKKEKTFGDENIRHNWPTVDSQPKVHHIKPSFKTAADRVDDIQIDFSTIEQKELPKHSEIIA